MGQRPQVGVSEVEGKTCRASLPHRSGGHHGPRRGGYGKIPETDQRDPSHSAQVRPGSRAQVMHLKGVP